MSNMPANFPCAARDLIGWIILFFITQTKIGFHFISVLLNKDYQNYSDIT